MTCRQAVDDFLMRYVEGELGYSEEFRFRLHLATCTNCRRYLDSYRKTVELGKGAQQNSDPAPSEVPQDLVKAILASRSETKR